MKKLAFAFAAALVLSAPAAAQSAASAPQSASHAIGPWQQDAAIGIQNRAANVAYLAPAASSGGANKGQPIALMAVGGAAIVLGALMDNDASGLLIVGGSVLGLYGLYLYLR
jgi:hypothetical protein